LIEPGFGIRGQDSFKGEGRQVQEGSEKFASSTPRKTGVTIPGPGGKRKFHTLGINGERKLLRKKRTDGGENLARGG